MTTDPFGAIANPIRRDLLAQLRAGPKPVHVLAAPFPRGRPAISEHLQILRDAGLVREERRGRERYYHLEARPLLAVRDWVAAYEQFWQDRFADLEQLLDEECP
jgi:DNA-binding transcriptional ArsR family regulator